jgi:zinc protease
VEQQIVAMFSPLTARAPAAPEPVIGTVPSFTGVRTYFHAEPESPATNVSLTALTPYVDRPDTAANRLKDLPRSIALAMLNRRFSELVKKEGAPFSAASASVSDGFRFMRQADVSLTCKPGQWTEALAVGEQELRRALEHGFQPGELKEIVATYANSLDQAVRTAATRRSGALANEILGASPTARCSRIRPPNEPSTNRRSTRSRPPTASRPSAKPLPRPAASYS